MEQDKNISQEIPEIAENNAKSNKNIAVIGFCAVLVIMLVAAIYFKMSKSKNEFKTETNEIGTKLNTASLEFKEEKPSFNELILNKPEIKQQEEEPFTVSLSAPIFEAKVYKSASLAIVANTGNNDEGSGRKNLLILPIAHNIDLMKTEIWWQEQKEIAIM